MGQFCILVKYIICVIAMWAPEVHIHTVYHLAAMLQDVITSWENLKGHVSLFSGQRPN